MPAAKLDVLAYNRRMVLRRTPPAVYDTNYHLVWAPKYRKRILQGELRQRVGSIFHEVADSYDITIEDLEVCEDHVHTLCSFPPRYSIAQVVTRFKSLSAPTVFREYPQVKRQLWGGEFWEDGYFARTLGDPVTVDVIRKYLEHHRTERTGQLRLFE